ncbi:Hydroxyacid oxidase 1 [Holothuria leucospilota]|uniref:(S)-2-hydroxy-acid oxidase n=1 Tax=Holothuria leucospilota TaxID=206669 RepID=A0A9Q1CB46_HOLLE|nr:Hydroxyacid oxidase 1 [Holothuria leucospilota]
MVTFRISKMTSQFRAVSLDDYEVEARKYLPADGLAFYTSGSDGEETLRDNTKAARRYRLRPRVLINVSTVDTSSTILGHPVNFPVCVSPSAWHKFAHTEAEMASAKGASEAGVAMTLSSVSTTSKEHLTSSYPNGLFFMQAYVLRSEKLQQVMLRDLKENGFKAVVLTVDCQVLSNRRKQFSSSLTEKVVSKEMRSFRLINYLVTDEMREAEAQGGGFWIQTLFHQAHGAAPTSLEYIQFVKAVSNLPVIVKGILSGKAARLAVENGADAVWISNHGGRQLNFTPSTLDVLSEVADAVKGSSAEVYIDSGFRTGTDVFKALAMGAKAVFIGRPVLWGLAVAGSNGVRDVLEILRDELKLCMTLCGCPNIAAISKSHVISESSYLATKL